MSDKQLNHSPLGHRSQYIDHYDNTLLFPILREPKRVEIGIKGALPFFGHDIWTAFEISWLNPKGKPVVCLADIRIPCDSSHLIESKSFKLYLNSLNNTTLGSFEAVHSILVRDLSAAAGAAVSVQLIRPGDEGAQCITAFEGICLDDMDIVCDEYHVNPELLKMKSNLIVEKQIYSHLLKSNCLVTGQPDWGSIQIHYTGLEIDEVGLLQYLVSFRNHNEFHEQCVERIFMDILTHCQPQTLTVYARYTRRGGLDINPIRSTEECQAPSNLRLFRQ